MIPSADVTGKKKKKKMVFGRALAQTDSTFMSQQYAFRSEKSVRYESFSIKINLIVDLLSFNCLLPSLRVDFAGKLLRIRRGPIIVFCRHRG